MCTTLILIALAALIVFWLINRTSFSVYYGDVVIGQLNRVLVDSYCAVNGPLFKLYPRFSNFSFSLLRKFIRASVIIFLIFRFHWNILQFVVVLTAVLAYMNYSARKKEISRVSSENRDALKPILKASARSFYFDVLMFILTAVAKAAA